MQSDGAFHRMDGGSARAFRFEMGSFQLEIPFGGTIGVVNQHEMRIRFQSFSLLGHRSRVLCDKAWTENAHNEANNGYNSQHIPRSAKIETAQIAANWRYDSAAGKPQTAGAHLLEPISGEREINGGGDGGSSNQS